MSKLYCLGLLTFIFLFASCEELTGKDTGANQGGENQQAVGGLAFVKLASGKYLFNGVADNGGDSSHNFEVKLKLPSDKKAAFFFYSSKDLSGGIRVSLKREADQVDLELDINGTAHSIALEAPTNEVLHLSIDIHNDHEDAHIIIWDGDNVGSDSEECVDEETCLYNTEFFTDPNPGPWGSQGKAPGSFWGYEGDPSFILELKGPLQALSNA